MIAVIGASGQLGSAFLRFLGASGLPVARGELDLMHNDGIEPWIESVRPELVINCAAYTAVDAAESDPFTAERVNAVAVGGLAMACASHKARLVTFSTDYVFDGEKKTAYVESDLPNPLNVYGRTKLEGERLALSAHPETLVIRTSWVLSATHENFISRMLDLISKGPVRVVDDQLGRPTLVDDLVVAVSGAIDAGATGLLHLTNAGQTTWFKLAREIARAGGLDPDQVTPCLTSEYSTAATRPLNSLLDSERLTEFGLPRLPDYRDSLAVIVRTLRESPPNKSVRYDSSSPERG